MSVFKMLDSSVRTSGYFKEKLFQVVSVFKQFSVSRIESLINSHQNPEFALNQPHGLFRIQYNTIIY